MSGSKWNWLLIITILLAVIDAFYLTTHYYKINILNPVEASFCSISQDFDCDEVAKSSAASIADIPVSTIGLFAYLFLAFLTLIGHYRKNLKSEILSTIVVIASLMFCFSIYMAFLSFTQVNTFCLLCIFLYILNLLIVIFAFLALNYSFSKSFSHFFGTIKSRPSYLFVLLLLAISSAFISLIANTLTLKHYESLDLQGPIVQENPYPSHNDRNNPPSTSNTPKSNLEKALEEFDNLRVEEINTSDSPIKGPDSAPIEIVDYSDFQCAYCKKTHDILSRISEKFKSKVKIIYKHYPLDQSCNDQIKRPMHTLACETSKYSYCAYKQGLFWSFADRIFENQQYLTKDFLVQLSENGNFNQEKFKKCLSDKANKRIKQDVDEANRIDIHYTPTLFLNGRRISNISPGPTESILEGLIKRQLNL